MKIAMLSLSLLCLSLGCAGTHAGAPALVRGDTRWDTCFPGRRYGEQQKAVIERMREEGASTEEVATKVGGSRQDVRCAEARAYGKRRAEPAQMALTTAR
jgi:hypothetical protein